MQRSSSTVLFSVRESKLTKNGECPIECRITKNGKRVSYAIGKTVDLKLWDKVKQQARGKSEVASVLNTYLESYRLRIIEKESELLDHGFTVTADLLRDAMMDKVAALKERTLIEVFEEHNEQQRALEGKGVSKATLWISEYTLRLVREFISTKFKRTDIYLRELNINFIKDFHIHLLKRMGQNSTTKHTKLLKKIINLCIANSYISFNPFLTFKIEREHKEVEFLDEAELEKIVNFESVLPRLNRARDMFLFACFTGLAYSDVKTLSIDNLEKDANGRIWIKKRRVKTGVLSSIPLLNGAKAILEKYKDHDKILPILDCADINKYLKDIAILCDINKRITFHTARHTFATTVTLSNRISLEVVAKMLGHTNTRMTAHYAKVVDSYIADEMDKLEGKF